MQELEINIKIINMRNLFFFFFCFSITITFGQTNYSESEIKQKNDSIVAEGNLLYQYERAAWMSSDIAVDKGNLLVKYGGYLIYQSGDSIKGIILEKDKNNCIYDITYYKNFTKPFSEKKVERQLTEKEQNLFYIKTKMLSASDDIKYNVVCPQGFNLNPVLIPHNDGYKLYLITGTAQSKVIPIGNDYIFFADKAGEITSMRKFHSRLIPFYTEFNGEKVREGVHSHLPAEPFITATDICTFKLYADLYGLDKFTVLSTALQKYFTYSIVDNKIVTKRLDSKL